MSYAVIDSVHTIQCLECAEEYEHHEVVELRPAAIVQVLDGRTLCEICAEPIRSLQN